MNIIKPQKEKYSITSAIFFSLLIHSLAGTFLVFCLSTGLISTPELNGINLVWVSFDDARGISKAEIKGHRGDQSPADIKKTIEKPARVETAATSTQIIPTPAGTAQNPSNTVALAKSEFYGTGAKEKSDHATGGANGNTDKISNPNTIVAYPLYKENSPPAYPEIARVRGYEGVVLVFAEILPNGRVGEVKIRKSSGYAILDQSAIRAIKPWKFEPAKKAGNPFTAWVELPIKFILHNNSQS